MSWTFCTSGAAVVKAGTRANSTITVSNAVLADWSDEAESMICDAARVDLITNYSDLTSAGVKILSMLSSAMIAQKIVVYDTASYLSSREAETILDVLENDIRRGLAAISEDKVKTYLGAN